MNGGQPFDYGAAEAHLRAVDPVVGGLIDRHGPYMPRPSGDPYAALVRTILFQQLAGAAASAIQRRWFALYSDEDKPPAAELLETTEEQFRSPASRAKDRLPARPRRPVVDGRLKLQELPSLSDDEVIEHLTAVKGIGDWSAHMFLMFHLGRPDVLPSATLACATACGAYGLGAPDAEAGGRDRRDLGALSFRRFLVYVARGRDRPDDGSRRIGAAVSQRPHSSLGPTHMIPSPR